MHHDRITIAIIGTLTILAQAAWSAPAPPESNVAESNAAESASAESAAPPAPAPPSNPDRTAPEAPDWAEEVLDKDPLAAKPHITLEDLNQGLADPERRDRIIADYFSRAEINSEEQREFLQRALSHESEYVRTQAAEQVFELNFLQDLLFEPVVGMLRSDDPAQRKAAIVALERFNRSGWGGEMLEQYVEVLLSALEGDDAEARDAALRSFERLGPVVIPILWKQLQSDQPTRRAAAAEALSRLVEDTSDRRFSRGPGAGEPAMAAPDSEPGGVPPPKAAADTRPPVIRVTEDKVPESVRVYFGTNREILPSEATAVTARSFVIPGALFLISLLVLVTWWRPKKRPEGQPPRRTRTIFVTVACLVTLITSILALNDGWRQLWSEFSGTKFGPRRNATGTIYYGFCDVSIPPTHKPGKVEQPPLGAEDEAEHVILRRTELLEDEQFFKSVHDLLARLPASERDCFVFVHGYNVSFDQAARRTAQIHFDLKFHGAPLFYSWPSRGDFRHYFSDRNEIGYSQALIRQFLVNVAERVKAERIHVVAHSMGADAVCRAISEIDEGQQLFHQIILAAPDIDADVFKSQIAPQITSKAQRTTLYCSRNDLALHASYAFNDSWRAGDSSRGILVLDGLDTIDASSIDTDLLGHSYYGDCLPILNDVEQLVKKNLAPSDRRLRAIPLLERLVYWTFSDKEEE